MQKFLSLMSFLISMNVAAAELPSEIQALLDQDGEFISIYKKKETDESRRPCIIFKDNENSISISAHTYFTPNASLTNARKEILKDKVIFHTKESGKRPGGSSACGNTPLLSYKKTVEVERRNLTIRQVYWCMFSRGEIVETCSLK